MPLAVHVEVASDPGVIAEHLDRRSGLREATRNNSAAQPTDGTPRIATDPSDRARMQAKESRNGGVLEHSSKY